MVLLLLRGLSIPLIIDLYLFFVPSSQDAEEDPAKIIANGEAKDGGEESWTLTSGIRGLA